MIGLSSMDIIAASILCTLSKDIERIDEKPNKIKYNMRERQKNICYTMSRKNKMSKKKQQNAFKSSPNNLTQYIMKELKTPNNFERFQRLFPL
jgi:hypothetical protein